MVHGNGSVPGPIETSLIKRLEHCSLVLCGKHGYVASQDKK